MGKPTTRKPASSSTENSCISREVHAWSSFACVHDMVREIGVIYGRAEKSRDSWMTT